MGGEQIVYGVHWKRVYVHKQYYAQAVSGGRGRGNTYLTNWEGTSDVVDQISLPPQGGGNLAYAFGYNVPDYTSGIQALTYGWGELGSVTLPSGAKVSYSYSLDGVATDNLSRLEAANVLNNKPARKELVYRQEYDLNGPVSNAPCNAQTEQCTSEVWDYNSEGVEETTFPQITTVTNPDGGVTSETFDSNTNSIYYRHSAATVYPDGAKIERFWQQNRVNGMSGQIVNPYVKTEFSSIKNAGGTYAKTAIKDYSYDKNGNVTAVREYDWVNYGSIQRDAVGRPTGAVPPEATLRRVTTNKYYSQTPAASDTTTDSPNAYYRATAPQWLSAIRWSEVGDDLRRLSRAEFYYDDPGTTGNLTESRCWDSTKGELKGQPSDPSRLDATNSVSIFNEYDSQSKNLTASIDANGIYTRFVYGAVAGPDGPVTDLYPTEKKSAEGTAVQRHLLLEYDFYLGLVTRTTDADNNVSASTTYDVFGRPTLVKAAEGLSEETHTVTVYSNVSRRVILRTDLNTTGDAKLVSVQHYDQLGRLRLSRALEDASTQSESDETAGIKVQTRYRYGQSNEYRLTSNPYRAPTSAAASGEATMGWTVTTADQGMRVVSIETFGGAGCRRLGGRTRTRRAR